MKKSKLLMVIPLVGMMATTSFGQEKRGTEKVKIITKTIKNGKEQITEEEFERPIGSSTERKYFEPKDLKDSTFSKEKKVTIIVDDSPNSNRDYDSNESIEKDTRIYRYKKPSFNKEEIKRKSQNVLDEIPYQIQKIDEYVIGVFDDKKTYPSIRDLSVFENNPRSETMNIKFRTAKKEKITLTLVDIYGKQISQETITDFSGDYFGQIKISKALKGSFILIVAQGEDAETERIVLK